MEKNDEREAKLPMWARKELQRLRLRLSEATATIAELTATDAAHTSAVYLRATAERDNRALPAGTTVGFRLEPDKYGDRVVEVRHDRISDGVVIRVAGGVGSLLLKPSSSNGAVATVEKVV